MPNRGCHGRLGDDGFKSAMEQIQRSCGVQNERPPFPKRTTSLLRYRQLSDFRLSAQNWSTFPYYLPEKIQNKRLPAGIRTVTRKFNCSELSRRRDFTDLLNSSDFNVDEPFRYRSTNVSCSGFPCLELTASVRREITLCKSESLR